jgi:hydroxyacylglutathione hydrolase
MARCVYHYRPDHSRRRILLISYNRWEFTLPELPLEIGCIVSAPFAENTYIVRLPGLKRCFLVDPGLEPEKIESYLDTESLEPSHILNTHGHSDHIGGNAAMKARCPDAPLIIGKDEAAKLTDAVLNLSAGFGVSLTSPPADQTVSEGDQIEAAGIPLEVLETPGHSCGHVVFVYKDSSPWIIFGGDVLFQGGIGRTDFPDGDFQQLVSSIHEKLFTMPDDTVVLPGHGPPTTIGDEKQYNPFVGKPAGFE